VWSTLRDELHPKGFELVTVGLDALGAEGCRTFVEAASPKHPSLLDPHHELAAHFGVTNIPQSIWIDEDFRIVRPPEAAPEPPRESGRPRMDLPDELPRRFQEMFGEASKIPNDGEAYHAALRDWVEQGAASRYALSPDEVIARSRPRDGDVARGHAHFELATWLERRGEHDAAVVHFRTAHRLVPESWTFRRQAWSLETVPEAGPLARFWQGPKPDDPDAWPYDGDWLSDVKSVGAENYTDRFEP
jgi:hypothetical protein